MPSSPEDITKRYLEAFKQVTTVDTAVILVVLAINQIAGADQRWVVPGIIGTTLSLLFAIAGLLLCAMQRVDVQEKARIPLVLFDVALVFTLALLFLGMFTSLSIIALGF